MAEWMQISRESGQIEETGNKNEIGDLGDAFKQT
jgi:hypothetical protein